MSQVSHMGSRAPRDWSRHRIGGKLVPGALIQEMGRGHLSHCLQVRPLTVHQTGPELPMPTPPSETSSCFSCLCLVQCYLLPRHPALTTISLTCSCWAPGEVPRPLRGLMYPGLSPHPCSNLLISLFMGPDPVPTPRCSFNLTCARGRGWLLCYHPGSFHTSKAECQGLSAGPCRQRSKGEDVRTVGHDPRAS